MLPVDPIAVLRLAKTCTEAVAIGFFVTVLLRGAIRRLWWLATRR